MPKPARRGQQRRGMFKPEVKLNPRRVKDLRGKTRIRGTSLRSAKHLKRGS